MTGWIVVASVVAVAVVVLVVLRKRASTSDHVGSPKGHPTTSAPLRVSWPPGYSSTRPIRTVRRPDSLYLIEEFPDRTAALEFLRGCEVRDERVYVIAENPQGNLGKDLVMIFEETDGALVELAERSPAPFNVSFDDCARCGYVVLPAAAPGTSAIHYERGDVQWLVSLDELELAGQGFKCKARSCRALICGACCRTTTRPAAADGELDLRCWICDGAVDVFQG